MCGSNPSDNPVNPIPVGGRGRWRRWGHRGFTLVELLVVVGIITLLVSILMPALIAARRESQRAACLSNMRQVGLALAMYLNENGRVLPYQVSPGVPDYAEDNAPANFLAELLPYLNNNLRVLECPSALPVIGTPDDPTDRSNTNYVANGAVLGVSVSRIRDSSRIIWLQELSQRLKLAALRPYLLDPTQAGGTGGTGGTGGGNGYMLWHDSEVYIDPSAKYVAETCCTVHGKAPQPGANCLYVDGHADYRPSNDLRSGDFWLVPDEGRTGTNSIRSDSGRTYTPVWSGH